MSELNINEDYDFGFSAHSDEELQEPGVSKAQKLYDLIIPLINNLLKDADTKPNIKWPGRKEVLENFKTKMKAILDGDDT